MAGNSGGPWGGGGNRGQGGGDRPGGPGGPRRPGEGQSIPEIDDLVRRGQEQLRVLMGGRGNRQPAGPGGGGGDFRITRGMWLIGLAVVVLIWLFNSLYTVEEGENSVELRFGEAYDIGEPGLNFALWPIITYEILAVTDNRTEDIGTGRDRQDSLMLTTDENIVDIDFQVVWNISNPYDYLFNLRDPRQTVRAVSEAAMREIIAQSQLAPILNRDRGLIEQTALELIQATLDEYEAGINILRVNLDRADPPAEVIDAFRDVQAAEQERDQLERQADAYANRVTAEARGEAAQILEEAEAYRARVVNEATGEASRFLAVLREYQNAPEVTRRRIYLETMEQIYGSLDLVILDDTVTGAGGGGSGVVPYLPLNELRRTQGAN